MSKIRVRNLRHRRLERSRYGQFGAFFSTEAARLASSATAIVTSVITFGTDTFTSVAHGLADGDGPFDVSQTALAAGLDDALHYYVSVVDANNFQLHLNLKDALSGSNVVDITSNGTGNLSLTRAVDAEGLFVRMGERQVNSQTVRASTDIDDLEG